MATGDLKKLLDELLEEPAGAEHDKTAAAADIDTAKEGEPMEKLAADLESAGSIMAEGFVNRAVALFEKMATDAASSSHATDGIEDDKSEWGKVKAKLQKMHAIAKPGDKGHVRAEQAYKKTVGKTAPQGGTGAASY